MQIPARPGPRNAITDVSGVLVGHHHRLDPDAGLGSGWATGCTVVVAPAGATASVDVRGGGPGTRETDLLDPSHTVQRVDAVLLTGGSAYGLAAADGVMRRLEEQGMGIPMGGPEAVVPIVPGAVIFDLPVGGWHERPDARFGYRAAQQAGEVFDSGSVGAGVGARAGSLKGGIGTASAVLDVPGFGAVTVGALVVANPVGSVFDPATGMPWGAVAELDGEFGLRAPQPREVDAANAAAAKGTVLNTTIGVVATDAALSKAGCKRLAVAGQDGLARAVRPAHSPLDGDTIFALATGSADNAAAATAAAATTTTTAAAASTGVPVEFPADLLLLDAACAAAATCVERAIVHAVLAARSVAGIPAYRDVLPSAFGGERA